MPTKKAKQNEMVTSDPTMLIGVPLDCLPFGEPLLFPVYVHLQDLFVLFRKEGDIITEERSESLTSRMVETIFIPKSHWVEFIRSIEKSRTGLGVRLLCYVYLKDIEEKKEFFRHEIPRYRVAADNLAVIIQEDLSAAPKLIRRFHENSIFFANHSVNTAVYSLAMGCALSFSLEQLKLLSFATLFHNVGNLELPESLLFKGSPLTEKERHLIHTHTLKGTRILEELSLPQEVVRTAMQHHECSDGSGYPLQQQENEIHLFAKICHVASAYDILQSRTPYHEPSSLQEAKKKMLASRKKFNPELLELVQRLDF